MVWKSDERLNALDYTDQEERVAFRSGYSDGYHGYIFDPGDWPNSYSRGYWEGTADRKEDLD